MLNCITIYSTSFFLFHWYNSALVFTCNQMHLFSFKKKRIKIQFFFKRIINNKKEVKNEFYNNTKKNNDNMK